MLNMTFGTSPKVAILVKDTAFKQRVGVENHYINALVDLGIPIADILVLPLSYDKKKVSVKYAKEYLKDIREELPPSVEVLLVTDSEYFKVLTKERKAEPHHGYALPCVYENFTHLSCVLSINFQALLYAPDLKVKLDRSLQVVKDSLSNNYTDPGIGIIKEGYYPESSVDIADWLQKLHQHPTLTCDIEAFSLKFYGAGIGTISFAWNEGCGIAFNVDIGLEPAKVRELLKEFFQTYKGTLIYHNANYDIKVLIYQMFMSNLSDYKGMLYGIELMTRKFHDTKLIAYLVLNKCGKTSYKLKDLAQEFAGNWAQDDIHDITLIEPKKLLEYNLVDSLSTWYVYKKYAPLLLDEQQEDIYFDIFIPAVKVLLQTELVGMPINPVKVQEAKSVLQHIVDSNTAAIMGNSSVQSFQHERIVRLLEEENAKLKTKVRTYDEVAAMYPFNPGSNDQISDFIYTYLGYPVVDRTKNKAPAVGAATIAKLIPRAKSEEDAELFQCLITLAKADKVLTSFIPAFENAQMLPDGSYRLYGNFNLGGTQSGRLSSSGPNLQNIPSGSTYAKLIKECFTCIPGFIFGGADFNALTKW